MKKAVMNARFKAIDGVAVMVLGIECGFGNAGRGRGRTGKEDSEPCGEDQDHAREDDGGKVW
jgi:hypothetical protein